MAFTLTIAGNVTRSPGGTNLQGITVQLIKVVGGSVADTDVTDSGGAYSVSKTEATETGDDYYVKAVAFPPHYAEDTGPEVPHEHTAYDHDLVMAFTNNNPTKGTVGAQTWTRDTGTQIKNIAIADADSGDVLSMVKVSGPSWMTVSTPSQVQGRVSFDTTGVSPSNYSGSVRVTDNFGGTSSTENFNITIETGNTAPDLDPPGNQSYTNKSGPQTLQLVATDPDDDDITYSKTTGPSWGSVNSNTGLITFNTNNATKGVHNFSWRAHDGISGGDTESHTVTITNNAPVITAVGNQRYLKDTGNQTIDLAVTDVDTTDTHTWSKTVGPAWGTINSSSGLVTFDTDGLSDGTYSFTFRVTDGTDADTEDIDVEIYTATPAPAFAMVS